MQFLDKLLGRQEKKPSPMDAGPAGTRQERKAAGAMGYEAGREALSPRKKLGAAAYKKRVQQLVATGLTAETFEELRGQYEALAALEKYSVSSWMVSDLPALEQAIRAGDFATYEALK
jgi:hypothetical protein